MDIDNFESLDPEEQEKIFHKSSFREKGELLLHSHNPAHLTRSLSREELYLLTREMDIDERSEVIRYASLPQLFFVSDIDCWKQDRMAGKSFIQWLETLLAANEEQLVLWLTQMDYESVVSGFQHIIQVLKPDHEWTADEVLGDTPYFTIDQMYYICVNEENMQTVKQVLQILFERSRGRYFALLEGVMSEVEDQLEEEAYQRREMRLSERGFPDLETAQRIYRPITKSEMEKFIRNEIVIPAEKEGATPNYLTLWNQERIFLDDVLHSFQDDTTGVRYNLQEELAWLSNKVLACSGIDFSSEKKVRQGIDRARALINIGLEELSGRNLDKAREIAARYWLEAIFRWGAACVLDLKNPAQKIIKNYWGNSSVDFLNFLSSPYDHMMMGLLRAFPEYFDPSLEKEKFRDFKSMEDVERYQKAVLQIEAVHKFCFESCKKDFVKAGKDAGEKDLTDRLFLGTLFSHWLLRGKIKSAPLKGEEVLKLKDHNPLPPESKKSFIEALAISVKQEDILPYFSLFFQQFEEVLGQIPAVLPADFESPVFLLETAAAASKKPSKRKK